MLINHDCCIIRGIFLFDFVFCGFHIDQFYDAFRLLVFRLAFSWDIKSLDAECTTFKCGAATFYPWLLP